jgi:hypothetical protein
MLLIPIMELGTRGLAVCSCQLKIEEQGTYRNNRRSRGWRNKKLRMKSNQNSKKLWRRKNLSRRTGTDRSLSLTRWVISKVMILNLRLKANRLPWGKLNFQDSHMTLHNCHYDQSVFSRRYKREWTWRYFQTNHILRMHSQTK